MSRPVPRLPATHANAAALSGNNARTPDSPDSSTSDCACKCGIPSLLGMGIRQSKTRERDRDRDPGTISTNTGRTAYDDNQHNHHHNSGITTRGSGPCLPSADDRYGLLLPPGGGTGTGAGTGTLSTDRLRIVRFKVGIDKRLTTIDERSPGVLKYKTPHFRAVATVEVPALDDRTNVQFGWIQTCVNMQFINTYGEHGVTSWEFPEILSGRFSMVSDADGKQYPWYGARQEVHTVQGPSPKQQITVDMNDNFFPQVTWCVPVETHDRKPRLTQIHRKQKFFTFLAMRDVLTKEVHILRAVTWSMELTIGVNPHKPLGQRAWLVGPLEQPMPCILNVNVPIPDYALRPPNANRSQTLIWRPSNGVPKLVVPPIESTIDINKYLVATRGMGEKLRALLPES